MATGNNPIKYTDIFDLTDKAVIKELIDNLELVNTEYNKLADSIKNNSKVLQDGFARAANEVAEAMKGLNISAEKDRQELMKLALVVEELRKKLKIYEDQQKNGAGATDHAADSVNGLKKKIAELTTEYNSLSKSEEKEKIRMQEIIAEAIRLKQEQKELVDAMKLTRQQSDYVAGSYKALEERTKLLMKELKEMPNGFDKSNKAAQELVKEINENNTKLKEFDKTLNIHNRNVGNYADALGKTGDGLVGLGVALAATYLGFQSLEDFGEKIVSDNLAIADSLSDVQRTAGITAEATDELAKSLKNIDTRTTLEGLTALAIIGGQLGYSTTADLAGFTKAIDQLAVVLSGEIEGGAEKVAESLGKINEVFKTQKNEGTNVEEALLKTGSAILKLGQVGLATGEELADFTQRVGGVAAQAGVSLPTILAYGATLQEVGITAEVSGTAVTQLITALAKAPAKFYEVARAADPNLTLKGFTDLINTDTAEALNRFFIGLNKAGGTLTGFNGILAKLGIDGAKSNAVITSLAKNQELLALRVGQVQEAYNKGTLATEQFEIKNNNLAGAVSKLGNALSNAFVNSGFSRSIAVFINSLVTGRTAADRLTDSFVNQKNKLESLNAELPGLLKTYDDLTAKSKELGGTDKLAAIEQDKLNDTIQQIAKLLPESITQVDSYGNAVDIARGKIAGMTQAMQEQVKAANISAAQSLRDDIAERDRFIKSTEAIRSSRPATGGGFFAGPSTADFNTQSREQIAQAALKNAEAIRKLRDVLLQELSPAEQKVYNDFFVDSKKVAEGNEQDARKIDDSSKSVIDNLDKIGKSGQRVKTEIEKLGKTVDGLRNSLESQAIRGQVSQETLDKYVASVNRLEAAQRAAQEAITSGLDPIQNLTDKSDFLNQKLQRQVGLGEDTTTTLSELTDTNAALQKSQDELNISIAASIGQMEVFNTQLNIAKRNFETDIASGNDFAESLKTLGEKTKELDELTRNMNLAILSATDPMAHLAAQAEEFKRILTLQAAENEDSTETVIKYKNAINALSEAQDRLNKLTKYNPRDPDGKIVEADIDLEKNQQNLNKFEGKSNNGDRMALDAYREAQKKRLEITLQRLDAEQKGYDKTSLEFERIETEKTKVIADQEKLRTDITKTETQKRAEFIQQTLELLSTGVNGYFDIQKSRRDNDLAEQEAAKNKELALAGNNAAAQDKINERYAKKEAEIKRKQAQEDKLAALFNIAINTAMGATKAVASSPLTGGMPFLAFVLAQGALQAALVAAQPLPKYFKGRANGGAEYAILGEQGPEAVESRDGSMRLTPAGAHIGFLNAGDKVHTAASIETRILQDLLYASAGNAGSDSTSRAYMGATMAIMKAKQGYDIYTVAQAVSAMGKTFNVAAMEAAFASVMDARPYQSVAMDITGFRVYEHEKNLRIERLNNRNTFFGKG